MSNGGIDLPPSPEPQPAPTGQRGYSSADACRCSTSYAKDPGVPGTGMPTAKFNVTVPEAESATTDHFNYAQYVALVAAITATMSVTSNSPAGVRALQVALLVIFAVGFLAYANWADACDEDDEHAYTAAVREAFHRQIGAVVPANADLDEEWPTAQTCTLLLDGTPRGAVIHNVAVIDGTVRLLVTTEPTPAAPYTPIPQPLASYRPLPAPNSISDIP